MRQHLTYANVVATLAVFIALGGGLAVGASLGIGSKDVKRNSLRSRDIASHTLRGKELHKGAVGGREVDESELRGLPPESSGTIPAARVVADNLISVGNSPADTALPFDVEDYDTADLHEAGATKLTPPIGGIYAITASVVWDELPDFPPGNDVGIYLSTDQQPVLASADDAPISEGWTPGQTVSTVAELSKGESVQVFAFINGSGDRSIPIVPNSPNMPSFTMTWLGPAD